MKTMLLIVCACMLIAVPLNAVTVSAETGKEVEEQPLIQIALLLDTSNSMDGLIDQAKQQLWKIVNEFVTAKREGRRPEFNVALYEYGNDRLNAKEGYIRQVLPLTTDLDKVSEELFALTTNGGSEFCGHVIRNAVTALDWSKSADDFKVIFIAGNEPFTQGGVDYKGSCKSAITKGIVINTIFCGNYEEGVRTFWKDGATRADGTYMNIDQDKKLVHIDTPHDTEIARLNNELNKTYIAYGIKGEAGMANQVEQDSNAAGYSAGIVAQRTVTKSSSFYKNTTWDLVDAIEEKEVKLDKMKSDDLPEEMRKMTLAEQKKYVAEKAKKRSEIQKQIQALGAERKKYVAAEMKKLSESGDDTRDAVMIKSVREQAQKKNFKFE